MDRINLLLAALAPGAANPAEGPSDAVESARADLKGEVERHFGGRVEAKTALERYAEKPEVERERLKDLLDSTGVVEDFAIVAAAQNVLRLADPEGAAAGKYAVQAQSLGVTIGH